MFFFLSVALQGGLPAAGIDSDYRTFANHGCNGTNNFGEKFAFNEMNLVTEPNQHNYYEKYFGESRTFSHGIDFFYHPYRERHYPFWRCQQVQANRNIDAGEEIFYNYLTYAGNDDLDWIESIEDLKNWCNGGIGYISQYDMEKQGF